MNFKILNELDRILKANPSLLNDRESFCQVINGTFDVDLDFLPVNNIAMTAALINDRVLELYFSKVWQPETKKYKYSGLAIIDEINAMNPSSVIDVGCGYNEFKGKIHNLIGIDPYNNRADMKCAIEDYTTDVQHDVAICLGSINFGSSERIIKEMTKVVECVKSGGKLYFRVNPGLQHEAPESRWINFYDWDPVFISNIAQTLGCSVETIRQDVGNRIYFVLNKDK